MIENLKSDLTNKMEKALEMLKKEFAGIRTGRASTSLIEFIHVEVYGNKTPINQLGTVSVQDHGKLLTVQVWDKSAVKNVEKAINDANIGVNASSEGQLIRIPIPPLSEERRKEMVKLASKYAEQSRISIRNIRREGMDVVKQAEKEHQISEDEMHKQGDVIQKVTNEYIGKIDELFTHKERDITSI
ncbi:MAG: ribosome recycling factor [Rickettsiales bacterium]|nr:ribosome recycling factor [Rickettsiales bacterium]